MVLAVPLVELPQGTHRFAVDDDKEYSAPG